MVRTLTIAIAAMAALATTPVCAETVQFEGVQFETPDDMARFDGRPRPRNTPFVRYRNGSDRDAQFDVIEGMAGPEADLAAGGVTRETYAEYSLRPATMFCGEHQVLRNTTRTVNGATIVDAGFLCLRHSRSPEFSRQIVRNIAVFRDGQVTMLQFVRKWKNVPQADDQLSPEEWMSRTDAFAASVQPCATAC